MQYIVKSRSSLMSVMHDIFQCIRFFYRFLINEFKKDFQRNENVILCRYCEISNMNMKYILKLNLSNMIFMFYIGIEFLKWWFLKTIKNYRKLQKLIIFSA